MRRILKSTWLSAVVGLLAATGAHAQLGLKGGLNAAVLDGDRIAQTTNYTLSYHAGAFYTYHIAGVFSLRPELLYSVQGSNFQSAKEDFTTNLSYLQLPLLADLRVGRLHLQAGPQFGVLLQAQRTGTAFSGYNATTGAEEFGNVADQVTEQYKHQDFSLCLGAEYRLVAGLRLGARFTTGLNDVADYRDVRSANDPRLQNRVLQAYAAFQFGEEKK